MSSKPGQSSTDPSAPGPSANVDWRTVFGARGWGAPVLVLATGFLVTSLLWTPLSWPARMLNGMISTIIEAIAGDGTITTCSRFARGSTELEWCAVMVGLFTVIGPLMTIVILFVFRRQVRQALTTVLNAIPEAFRYLVAPLVAVIVFTIGWAGVHFDTAYIAGLVGITNRHFPLVIGAFTFVTVQYGKDIHLRMVPILEKRDRFPVWIRFVVTFAVPLLLAIALTREARVTNETLKEHVIVLVAIAAGWFLIAPRMDKKGSAAINEAVEDVATRARRKSTEASR